MQILLYHSHVILTGYAVTHVCCQIIGSVYETLCIALITSLSVARKNM